MRNFMSLKAQKKELYQLMISSISLQSMDSKERLMMQDKILNLDEPQMQQMILILRNEQSEMKELHRRSKMEQKESKKLDGMVDSLRDAGHILDKAFLSAREADERNESSKISSDLLKQIDLI